jgi:glutathione reductase (NADPH)
VIRGCVPKKLLVYASEFTESFEDAAGFGWHPPTTGHDISSLLERKVCICVVLNCIFFYM